MAKTYVGRIIEAMAAAIDTDGKPQGLAVSTSRQTPVGKNPAIFIFPAQDKPADDAAGPRNRAGTRRFLTVAVVCRCAGTDLDNEELRAWAAGRLLSDTTLGGNAVRVIETVTDWQGEIDSQNQYSMAVMQFMVEYARPIETLIAS